MTVTPPSSPNAPQGGGGRVGPLPVLGCVLLLLVLVVVFGTAVGGSFQSLAILGGLIAVGGIALVVVLAKKNRRG